LANEGEKCPLKGACSFGAPYCLQDNIPHFKNNAFHFYDFSMGFNFYQNVIKPQFPILKSFIEEEKFEQFRKNLFDNRYSMMDMDARALIPFFGYSGPNALDDYY
jgi:hypothetical protein